MRTNVALMILLLGPASPLLAQEEPDPVPAADSVVRAFMVQHRAPAVSVAVWADGEIAFRAAQGLADVENGVPAGPETVFRIASVTKPLTATGVMRLAESGLLDLDAPAGRYCDAWPDKRWPVTARQLLAHLGGVRDYTRIERGIWRVRTRGGFQEGSSTVYIPTLDEAVAVFAEDSLAFEPGTAYRYSNLGYVLLGCAMEGATGRSYAEIMRREVFRPAGMSRTQPNDAWAVIPDRARNYQMRTEATADRWWFIPAQQRVLELGRLYNARFEDTSHKLPAGGLLSTPSDLVRLASELMEGTLLADSTVAEMFSRQRTRTGDEVGWGLGWTVDTERGQRVVGLGGGQAGVSAILILLPDRGWAVAALTNRDFVPLSDLVESLAALWGYPLAED